MCSCLTSPWDTSECRACRARDVKWLRAARKREREEKARKRAKALERVALDATLDARGE